MHRSAVRLAAVLLSTLATPAFAHPGHLAEESGHAHWLALAALGLAVAVGAAGLAWRALRRRRPEALNE